MRQIISYLLLVTSLTFLGCASTPPPPWGTLSESEIAAWKEVGVQSVDVLAYAGAGIDAPTVKQWMDKGFSSSQAILSWFGSDFSPDSAASWRDAGFDVETAVTWLAEKFTPQEAQGWVKSGFDLATAIENRGKGLSPIQ